ncbi:hypothetical protein PVK06_018323 [Gossypium arboreum]|uniref:Uncharacterized protein n=1 Tax=Gossypium arboreum TaxID=29729 RepID=A0ABR0Q536_GOSAR|nr:hypothetical protein PVK06_018323 [Gossypium arboreum]
MNPQRPTRSSMSSTVESFSGPRPTQPPPESVVSDQKHHHHRKPPVLPEDFTVTVIHHRQLSSTMGIWLLLHGIVQKFVWGAHNGSSKMALVLRSKYKIPSSLLDDLSRNQCSFLWRSISKIFIWLALKQRLFTNAERVRRGFGSNSACSLCGYNYEDVLYILRDCNAVRGIWDKLIPQQYLSAFYSGYFLDWMRSNLQSHSSSWGGINWPCLFGIIVWVSLSSDGSVRFDEGFVADGGCVRDHNGEWIIGFAKYLGNCTILEAELWGILDGLNLILDRSFRKFLIQTDSIEVVNAILEDSPELSRSALVRKNYFILRKMDQWKIQYIPKEDNLIC